MKKTGPCYCDTGRHRCFARNRRYLEKKSTPIGSNAFQRALYGLSCHHLGLQLGFCTKMDEHVKALRSFILSW